MIKFILILFLVSYSNKVGNNLLLQVIPSNEDLLLASVLQAECNYCSDVDKHLIISSILNRCENENYPNNVEDILQAYSKTSFKKVSKTNLDFVLNFDKEIRNKEVLYFFNSSKSTNKSFIKKIRKKTDLIIKTKYHEYRGYFRKA